MLWDEVDYHSVCFVLTSPLSSALATCAACLSLHGISILKHSLRHKFNLPLRNAVDGLSFQIDKERALFVATGYHEDGAARARLKAPAEAAIFVST